MQGGRGGSREEKLAGHRAACQNMDVRNKFETARKIILTKRT